jgi:hypothetical protein
MSVAETSASDIDYPFELAYVAIPLSSIVCMQFWNAGTTIEVKLVAAIVGVALGATPIMASFLWYWFRRREDLPYVPAWNLKQDSPGMWVLTGVMGALVLGGVFAWLSYLLVGVVAQHVKGDISVVPARIVETTIHDEQYKTCDVTGDFSVGWNDRVAFCVKPSGDQPMSNMPLEAGQTVKLLIKDNALGKVVIGIEGTSNHDT